MQVTRRVTAEQSLAEFVRLARASKLSADEHEHLALQAEVIKTRLDEANKLEQELAQLKAEHAKCTQQPTAANPGSGSVASEGNGAQLGEGGGPLGASIPVQELIQ